jgi:hypothetical protein
MRLTQIISGGQTGADRAGLEVALLHSFPHGGWCPKGRKAEDGPIEAKYDLTETPSANYLQRTEWNVRDTDGTIVFTITKEITGGSMRTVEFARKHNKPYLHVSLADSKPPESKVTEFIKQHGIKLLNIAGSRESKEPGINEWVHQILNCALFSTESARESGKEGRLCND